MALTKVQATNIKTLPALTGESLGLVIKNNDTNPNFQLDITAEEIILRDANLNVGFVTSVSNTVDITVSGVNGLDTGTEAVNTWYHIWCIAKEDGTKGCLLSASSSSPTLPSGYTYKARIGAVYNDAAGNFRDFMQRGKRVMANSTEWVALASGASATRALIDMSAFVPPTSTRTHLHTEHRYTTTGRSLVNFFTTSTATNPIFTTDITGAGAATYEGYNTVLGLVLPNQQQIYYFRSSGTTAVWVIGFDL
jgi:hypothetical protein